MSSEASLMSYQEWCVNMTTFALRRQKQYCGRYNEVGYKTVLKYFVRHYPEVVRYKSRQVKIYSNEIPVRLKHVFYKPYVFSCEAYAVAISGMRDRIKQELYQEHITPCEYSYRKLAALPLDGSLRNNISSILEQSKIVYLSKKYRQQDILDGRGAKIGADDIRLLNTINGIPDAEVAEAESLIGKSSKQFGTGLLRFAKLYKAGVRFKNGAGDDLRLEDCYSYLTRRIESIDG